MLQSYIPILYAKYLQADLCENVRYPHIFNTCSEGTRDNALTDLLIVVVSFVTTMLIVGGIMTIIF